MKYKKTEGIIKEAADYFASQTQLQLKAKHPRTSIRAEWKRVGNDWQPEYITIKKVRANYVASGNLVRSIKPIAEGLEFGVEYDRYGDAIRKGRKPWPGAKGDGDKGIPIKRMREWTKIKGLRPRDLQSGSFLKNTQSNRNAMGFLMNRKIKHFGIEPFDFVQMPRRVTMDKYMPQIREAITEDIKDNLK